MALPLGDLPADLDPSYEYLEGRLVDSVFDGIVTFDDQGKVLSWNRAAEHMFGDPIEQVRGKSLGTLLPLLGEVGPEIDLSGAAFPVEEAGGLASDFIADDDLLEPGVSIDQAVSRVGSPTRER